MKYSVALIMAVAAIGSSAQSLSDLPQCGQGCIQRLIGAAEGLGCKAGDIACLCKNPDFTYGIRDCSNEACTDSADAIINYGAEYCKSNGGVVITTSGTAVTTAPATGTDASNASGGAGGAGGLHTKSSDGDVAVATSTLKTVVEESGSSVSKTDTETFYSSPTGSSSSGDSTKGGAAGGSDSTKTNKDGATTTKKSDSTSTNGGGNSDNNGGDGNAAVNAAAPVGLLAAAGIMAMLI